MSEEPTGGASEPPSLSVPVETTVELLARARQGDRSAIEVLFTRHLKPLQRFAQGRLPRWARDLAETDDLVQDALLQTLKRLEGFEPRHPGALQAYLRQAVMNRLRDEMRRHVRTPDRVDLDEAAMSERSLIEETIDPEIMASYNEALARLTPEQREAIIGRVELGLSYGELALALDKPTPDAARKAARRALVELAREMQRER